MEGFEVNFELNLKVFKATYQYNIPTFDGPDKIFNKTKRPWEWEVLFSRKYFNPLVCRKNCDKLGQSPFF